MPKPRARALGLPFPGTPGEFNAITDVPGVRVGYCTIVEGDGPLRPGQGPVRTGVTAVMPRSDGEATSPVWAGFHALNGNGEMTGTHWIRDGGCFYGPVLITNTHSVGVAHHAAVRWMIETAPETFEDAPGWALPVVAETYDGVLNDINGQHVTEDHVFEALRGAGTGPVAEGNVGGGTGMICYEFKGGTGTSSRLVDTDGTWTVAALVQANHGRRDLFTVLGVPVGRHLRDDLMGERESGLIIVVLATDAPLMPYQLDKLARRATLGIGRHGTQGGNSSGDIFLAFSVANAIPRPAMDAGLRDFRLLTDEWIDPLYQAAVEATEEAVLNAMLAADDMPTLRPPGRTCRALDGDALVQVMRRYGRMGSG